MNPAFSGVSSHPVVSLNYRNQWPSFGNTYTTYHVGFDRFFDQYNSGIGVSLLNDDSGDGALVSTNASLMYSYSLLLNNDFQLKMGIGASYVQQRLDGSRLIFGEQIDRGTGVITQGGSIIPNTEGIIGNISNSYLDISSGFLLYNKFFYVGFSLNHLNTPNQSYLDGLFASADLPVRFSLHGGYQINLRRGNKKDEGTFITPNILFERQGDFYQVNIGAYTGVKSFFIGLWYRNAWNNNDAVIVSTGIKKGPFKIGYSFDYTISDLTIGSGGAHEIGILINLYGLGSKKSKLNDI